MDMDTPIASRIPGSPYPVSQTPSSLFVVDDNALPKQDKLTLQSVQGRVARAPFPTGSTQIWRLSNNAKWLDDLVNIYKVQTVDTYKSDLKGLVQHYKRLFCGYVRCTVDSPNEAIAVAGCLDALVVTPENETIATENGLTMLLDASTLSAADAWQKCKESGKLSNDLIIFQDPGKSEFLGDIGYFAKAFRMYESPPGDLSGKVFDNLKPTHLGKPSFSSLFGWGGDEHDLVAFSSKRNVFVHAADYCVNLSTLMNFEVPKIHQKPLTVSGEAEADAWTLLGSPTTTEMQSSAFSEKCSIDGSRNDAVHTVCFVFTDGDNLQYVCGGGFSNDGNRYGSANRGKSAVGWTMAPALAEVAPTVLQRVYDDATRPTESNKGGDYFIAGPSGVGYVFPDNVPADTATTYASMTNDFMKKSDMRIVNLLGAGDDAPDTVVEAFAQQDGIDAVMWYGYSNYASMKGRIKYASNQKPCIGARELLWDIFNHPDQLAAKINSYPKDPTKQAGYSLIPVHIWSMDLNAVLSCISMLDKGIEVVSPQEFVSRICANKPTE
eukprot:GFYU01009147.1.p1 GENE.GFYU01009147.1~~GFYU01009147.1.p1  ORF type:complete len:569 (+),score=143.92 GFYU01009147.1:59-1708(+)